MILTSGSPSVLVIIASLSILLLVAAIVIAVFVVKSKLRKRKKIESKRIVAAKRKKVPSEECWVAESSNNTNVGEESKDLSRDQVYYDPTYDYMEVGDALTDVNPECK